MKAILRLVASCALVITFLCSCPNAPSSEASPSPTASPTASFREPITKTISLSAPYTPYIDNAIELFRVDDPDIKPDRIITIYCKIPSYGEWMLWPMTNEMLFDDGYAILGLYSDLSQMLAVKVIVSWDEASTLPLRQGQTSLILPAPKSDTIKMTGPYVISEDPLLGENFLRIDDPRIQLDRRISILGKINGEWMGIPEHPDEAFVRDGTLLIDPSYSIASDIWVIASWIADESHTVDAQQASIDVTALRSVIVDQASSSATKIQLAGQDWYRIDDASFDVDHPFCVYGESENYGGTPNWFGSHVENVLIREGSVFFGPCISVADTDTIRVICSYPELSQAAITWN
jgi:hypothetical protein